MSIQEIISTKSNLVAELLQNKAVFLMMSSYQNEEVPIGYEMDGSLIYGSELGELLDQEVEAAKLGNYITVEELAKRSQKWLTLTK